MSSCEPRGQAHQPAVASIQVTVDLYGHFQPGGGQHHVEDLAAAVEAERGPAEARVLSAQRDSSPAPDGTLVAPSGAAPQRGQNLNA